MLTLGLDRLEELRREGGYLFQGTRFPWRSDEICPVASLTSLDPRAVRGTWVPRVGLLAQVNLVRFVFASGWAAALTALSQRPGIGPSLHIDEFPDGAVALTIGENGDSRGAIAEVWERAQKLKDQTVLGDCFVDVVSKHDFKNNAVCTPFAGEYYSSESIPVLERTPLTAGDVRALAGLLEEGVPFLDIPGLAQADPFTGPFAQGGQLLFAPGSGARLRRRQPGSMDRKVALAFVEERGNRWIRHGPQAVALTSHQRLVRQSIDVLVRAAHFRGQEGVGRRSRRDGFRRAVSFVEENCTQGITVEQIADAARVSKSQLHLLFREVAGCGPLAYASDRRLNLAESLLGETKLTVAAIAEQCGFAEQASLTRSLRKRRGVSPSEFRKSVRVLNSGSRSTPLPPAIPPFNSGGGRCPGAKTT